MNVVRVPSEELEGLYSFVQDWQQGLESFSVMDIIAKIRMENGCCWGLCTDEYQYSASTFLYYISGVRYV